MTPLEIIIIADGEDKACCTKPRLKNTDPLSGAGIGFGLRGAAEGGIPDLNRNQDHPLVRQAQPPGESFRSSCITGG